MMMGEWDPEKIKEAWDYATRAHQGQMYGGTKGEEGFEYINHVGSVAMELLWSLNGMPFCDYDLAIQCALLHDVLEDTTCTFDELKKLFGDNVAEGVLALTKDQCLGSKEAQMKDSLKRILQQPKEIWMVKMADRISNLHSPPQFWKKCKMKAYQKEAMLIYETLSSSNSQLAKRLRNKITEYARFYS